MCVAVDAFSRPRRSPPRLTPLAFLPLYDPHPLHHPSSHPLVSRSPAGRSHAPLLPLDWRSGPVGARERSGAQQPKPSLQVSGARRRRPHCCSSATRSGDGQQASLLDDQPSRPAHEGDSSCSPPALLATRGAVTVQPVPLSTRSGSGPSVRAPSLASTPNDHTRLPPAQLASAPASLDDERPEHDRRPRRRLAPVRPPSRCSALGVRPILRSMAPLADPRPRLFGPPPAGSSTRPFTLHPSPSR